MYIFKLLIIILLYVNLGIIFEKYDIIVSNAYWSFYGFIFGVISLAVIKFKD